VENISTDMTEDNDTAPADGESWTNPLSIEIDKRKAELMAMPGFQLKLDLDALGRAGHVMYKNAEELSHHATQFLTGRRFSRDVDDEFEKELVRFLHNYLTSVYSLIEAQRVVMRHCWGDGVGVRDGRVCRPPHGIVRNWRSRVHHRAAELLHAPLNPVAGHKHHV
jgi:hypothetical protein